MVKSKKKKQEEQPEGDALCESCGNKIVEEEGEGICPKCDTRIDFFGEEEKE